MARIMRSGCLNLLILLVLSTKLMNTLHAQPPSSGPVLAPPIGPSPVPLPPPNGPAPAPPSGLAPAPLPPPNGPAPASPNGPTPDPSPPSGPVPAPPSGPAPDPLPPPSGPAPAPPHGPVPAPQPPPPTIPQPSPLPPAPLPQPGFSATQGSRGLSGRQKAGIVLGVLVGAGLIGLIGMVCIKRHNNIRRTQYAEYARRPDL